MIFEIVQARGLTVWLNGRSPLAQFSYGDSDEGSYTVAGGPSESIKFPTGDAPNLGVVEVRKILFDKHPEAVMLDSPETEPTEVTLRLLDREIKLKVTKVVIGDPDAYDEEEDEYGIKVTLANGEPFFVDEISVYIRAEA